MITIEDTPTALSAHERGATSAVLYILWSSLVSVPDTHTKTRFS